MVNGSTAPVKSEPATASTKSDAKGKPMQGASVRPPRPSYKLVESLLENIPEYVKARPNWVGWRYDWRKNEWTKEPHRADWSLKEIKLASSTDPTTWAAFDVALLSYKNRCRGPQHLRFDGIGYTFSLDDNLMGVDLDDCLDEHDNMLPWAAKWVAWLGPSYIERSPSGRGVKILFFAKLPTKAMDENGVARTGRNRVEKDDEGNRLGKIELFDRARYFTLTGDVWKGKILPIAEPNPEALAALVAHVDGKDEKKQEPKRLRTPMGPASLNDQEIIDKARNAANGEKFRALFERGDTHTWHGGDDSVADAGLCRIFAFWTQDAAQIERLMSCSALGQREKWINRKDYRDDTIGYALDQRGETYQGSYSTNGDGKAHSRTAPAAAPEPSPLEWNNPPGKLTQELEPVPALDVLMIPAALRPWNEQSARQMGVPVDVPAISTLWACGTVLGRKIAIRPKRHDTTWNVVSNLWVMAIGNPGEMKSHSVSDALAPLRRLEAEADDRHKLATEDYECDKLIAAAGVKDAKKSLEDAVRKKQPREVVSDLAKRARKAATEGEPVCRRYTTTDATPEALQQILSQNPNGIGIVRDELEGLFRQWERSGREGEKQFFMESWNGTAGAYNVDRIGRGRLIIENPCVSIIGITTPGPVKTLLREMFRGEASDDGLLQRFNMVWPDPLPEWHNVDEPPNYDAKNAVASVLKKLDETAAFDLGASVDPHGRFPFLHFDECDAQDIFNDWREKLEATIRATDLAPVMKAHLGKYRSLMPRLALIFHLVDTVCEGGNPGPVSAEAATLAIQWCEYLEAHARRVYASVNTPDLDAGRALAARIEAGAVPSPFQVRTVSRNHWSGLSDTEDVHRAVAALVRFGWLQYVDVQTGGRPREDIHIHPSLPRLESTPAPSAEP